LRLSERVREAVHRGEWAVVARLAPRRDREIRRAFAEESQRSGSPDRKGAGRALGPPRQAFEALVTLDAEIVTAIRAAHDGARRRLDRARRQVRAVASYAPSDV